MRRLRGRPRVLEFRRQASGWPAVPTWAAALVKERTEQLGKDDPVGLCRPGGALRILTFPPFRKFLQLPDLFVILSERDVTYRQVFMDGRPLPADPTPTFNGYSIGRWEGDALVVTSNGFRDGTWLDRNGSPMSDAAKLTERFRRVSFGRLEVDVTLDDPKVYTRPWTVTLTQLIVLDTELLDYHCMDNEKDAKHMVGKWWTVAGRPETEDGEKMKRIGMGLVGAGFVGPHHIDAVQASRVCRRCRRGGKQRRIGPWKGRGAGSAERLRKLSGAAR